ncbi:hypothetical protein M432DRAFT_430497 [Thermoascus aurantiacus ATCC 26904]
MECIIPRTSYSCRKFPCPVVSDGPRVPARKAGCSPAQESVAGSRLGQRRQCRDRRAVLLISVIAAPEVLHPPSGDTAASIPSHRRSDPPRSASIGTHLTSVLAANLRRYRTGYILTVNRTPAVSSLCLFVSRAPPLQIQPQPSPRASYVCLLPSTIANTYPWHPVFDVGKENTGCARPQAADCSWPLPRRTRHSTSYPRVGEPAPGRGGDPES